MNHILQNPTSNFLFLSLSLSLSSSLSLPLSPHVDDITHFPGPDTPTLMDPRRGCPWQCLSQGELVWCGVCLQVCRFARSNPL